MILDKKQFGCDALMITTLNKLENTFYIWDRVLL